MCDEGAAFNMPTTNVRINHVSARTRSSCFVTGSEDQGGVHNVTVIDYTCRDSPGGIILKDTTLPHSAGVAAGGGLGFPKSNFSFSDITLHNISGYWPIAPGGHAQPGQGAAIQGVRGFSLNNVTGDLVPKAGSIQWASDVRLSNISSEVMAHGFSCGSNATDVMLDGKPLGKCGGGGGGGGGN